MPFEGILKYPLIFAFGAIGALVATPAAMWMALRLGMVDKPDARRVHTRPTPRGGGIAVFLAFHAACAAIFLLPWTPFSGGLTIAWWHKFLPLSSLLVLVGFIDDFRGMRPWIKLGGQVAVAVGAWWMDLRVGSFLGSHLPLWADLILTVFWFVAIINAFNLIDGMDGVAAGLGSIASAGLMGSFFLRNLPTDCLVALGLMGACLGFLHYNFHPARVFLGDTGSMFIGFALASISVSTSTKGTAFTALAVPALVVGVPLFDTFLAVWRRSARKILGRALAGKGGSAAGRVFGADLDHLHHRLLARGQSQRRVAFLLYVAAAGLVAVGLLGLAFHNLASGIYLLAFIAALYVVVRHVAHVELWDSASALVHGLSRPIRREIVVPAYIVADLLILGCTQLLAHLLMRDASGVDLRAGLVADFAYQVGLPFVGLAATGTYRRIWSRARIMDFIYLMAALGGGLAAGLAVAHMIDERPVRGLLIETSILFWMALLSMVALRVFRRVAADLRSSIMAHGHHESAGLQRALVYGAGHTGLLFLHMESGAVPGSGSGYRVVGFLDDDTNLHGRIMHGYTVMGGRETLETLLPTSGAELVIVTARLDETSHVRLRRVASACGVRVLQWRTELEEFPPFRQASSAMAVSEEHPV